MVKYAMPNINRAAAAVKQTVKATGDFAKQQKGNILKIFDAGKNGAKVAGKAIKNTLVGATKKVLEFRQENLERTRLENVKQAKNFLKAMGVKENDPNYKRKLEMQVRLTEDAYNAAMGSVNGINVVGKVATKGPALLSGIKSTVQRLIGKGTGKAKYQVGAYQDIKGVEGLDAHHVGQKSLMKKLVENYDPNTAPAINVPKVGHTISGPNGIVSRSTNGISGARQLLARDIMELRRVYDDIPNSALKELIELNKKMYPEMRK